MAPLAPGRGEGPGVRGEVPLEAGFAEPRMSTDEGCFWATDEHGFSRMNRRGSWAFSPFNFLVSPHYGRDAMAPSPPTPLPLRGRGEEFQFSVVSFQWSVRSCGLEVGGGITGKAGIRQGWPGVIRRGAIRSSGSRRRPGPWSAGCDVLRFPVPAAVRWRTAARPSAR